MHGTHFRNIVYERHPKAGDLRNEVRTSGQFHAHRIRVVSIFSALHVHALSQQTASAKLRNNIAPRNAVENKIAVNSCSKNGGIKGVAHFDVAVYIKLMAYSENINTGVKGKSSCFCQHRKPGHSRSIRPGLRLQ